MPHHGGILQGAGAVDPARPVRNVLELNYVDDLGDLSAGTEVNTSHFASGEVC